MFSTLGLLPGCASWFGGVDYDLRQANNRFNYLDDVAQNREIKQPVGTDPIKFNEKFSLPKPILDSRAALIGKEVDVRPPQKIMKLDSNIIGFQDGDLALVWFFPDEDGHQVTTNEVFTTIFSQICFFKFTTTHSKFLCFYSTIIYSLAYSIEFFLSCCVSHSHIINHLITSILC